jgi:hypothetical protein
MQMTFMIYDRETMQREKNSQMLHLHHFAAEASSDDEEEEASSYSPESAAFLLAVSTILPR